MLVLGLSYKENIDDDRESPSYELIEYLQDQGAHVEYCDPYFPQARHGRRHSLNLSSVPCDNATFGSTTRCWSRRRTSSSRTRRSTPACRWSSTPATSSGRPGARPRRPRLRSAARGLPRTQPLPSPVDWIRMPYRREPERPPSPDALAGSGRDPRFRPAMPAPPPKVRRVTASRALKETRYSKPLMHWLAPRRSTPLELSPCAG